MSDLPKPATVEEKLRKYVDEKYAIKEPKPTGEWTPEWVAMLANKGRENEIVDAHKAALAATGQANIRTNEMLTNVRRKRDAAQKQLADEREKVQTLVDALKRIRDDKWIAAEASLHAADALAKVKQP